MRFLVRIIFILIVGVPIKALSQNKHNPDDFVGTKLPDYTFSNVVNYKKREFSLKDYKGRWLILDFWDKGCTACVLSFPHTNKLQQAYRDKFEFLLIGMDAEQSGEAEALYERCRKRMKLSMPCAFDDTFVDQFPGLKGVPWIIVADPKGIIRYVANSINSKDLDDLLAGKQIGNLSANHITDDGFPVRVVPADSAVIFQSSLSKSSGSIKVPTLETNGDMTYFSVSSQLKELYFFAYLGLEAPWSVDRRFAKQNWKHDEFFKSPILEIKDSTLFVAKTGTYLSYFDYYFQAPSKRINSESLLTCMQQDLERFFGYEITIQRRVLPYLKLVASNKAKQSLKAKGDTTYAYGSKSGVFRLKNQPVNMLILPYAEDKFAIVDETGIDGNIDIEFTVVPEDFEDYRRALKENGLDLVIGQKEMYCLVIRDPKNMALNKKADD